MAGGGLIQRCVVAKAEVSTQKKKSAADACTTQQLRPTDTVDNMPQGWVSGPETLQEAAGLLQSA